LAPGSCALSAGALPSSLAQPSRNNNASTSAAAVADSRPGMSPLRAPAGATGNAEWLRAAAMAPPVCRPSGCAHQSTEQPSLMDVWATNGGVGRSAGVSLEAAAAHTGQQQPLLPMRAFSSLSAGPSASALMPQSNRHGVPFAACPLSGVAATCWQSQPACTMSMGTLGGAGTASASALIDRSRNGSSTACWGNTQQARGLPNGLVGVPALNGSSPFALHGPP
jgi:hypothetical protein